MVIRFVSRPDPSKMASKVTHKPGLSLWKKKNTNKKYLYLYLAIIKYYILALHMQQIQQNKL